MTNCLEFFCIDMDKAVDKVSGDIDDIEDLLVTYADISDIETILINAGIDIGDVQDTVCDATYNIICIDIFNLLNMTFLVDYRPITDNSFCYM